MGVGINLCDGNFHRGFRRLFLRKGIREKRVQTAAQAAFFLHDASLPVMNSRASFR